MSKEILETPVAGKRYLVKKGDRFTFLASAVYGNSAKAQLIVDANPDVIGRPLSLENLPTIYAGDVLNIPEHAKFKRKFQEKLAGKDPDEFTLVIEGREIYVESAKITRTMDTFADGWTAEIPWTPGADKNIDEITSAYGYQDAAVYLGGDLIVGGALYIVTPTLGLPGQKKILKGFSYTVDMLDSTIRPPYEKNKVTLLQRCQDFSFPHEINVEVDEGVDLGGPFARVTGSPTQTEADHLMGLASQRGILLTSDIFGDLLLTVAKTNGVPVDTIEEDFPASQDYSITFDGRKRWQTYRAIGQSARRGKRSKKTRGKFNKSGITKDNVVSRYRFLTFQSDDTDSGDVEKSAEWKKNKAIADSLTFPFPASSWRDKSKKLWRENTLVTIKSETIGAPDGFTFLIRQVDYNYQTDGTPATLHLVPPEVYTREEIVEPWLSGGSA
jgi:prophage tail gpP-like protein